MDDVVVPGTRRRVYTATEVALHNCKEDCWLIVFGKVYDFSELIAANDGPEVGLLVRFAGTDVSHWFDKATGDVKMHVHPTLHLPMPFTPHGRFLHVPPAEPSASWRNDFGTPWWRDERFCIGSLSARTRRVRVMNTLTEQETLLEVGSEETLEEILARYLDYNAHAGSYTWKALKDGEFRPLDMTLTLEENGVHDESDEFEELGISEDFFIPVIHLYFNDDLTVA